MSNINFSYFGASGIACYGSVQRLSDSTFLQVGSNTFASGSSFGTIAFPLTAGTGIFQNSYTTTLPGDTWTDGVYKFLAYASGVAITVVGGTIFNVQGGVETAMGVNNVYFADIQFIKNQVGALDEYTVTWFKNGSVLNSSSVSNVSMTIIDRSTANTLYSGSGLTQIGTTATYKLDIRTPNQRQSTGNTYLIVTSATIDNSVRTFSSLQGRDM